MTLDICSDHILQFVDVFTFEHAFYIYIQGFYLSMYFEFQRGIEIYLLLPAQAFKLLEFAEKKALCMYFSFMVSCLNLFVFVLIF